MANVRSVVFCPRCGNMGKQVELDRGLECRTCGYSSTNAPKYACNPVSAQQVEIEAQLFRSPEIRDKAEAVAVKTKELSNFFRTLGDRQRRAILMDAYHVMREMICSYSDPENRKQHIRLAIKIGELGKDIESYIQHGGLMYGEVTPRAAVKLDDDEEEFRKQLEGE